MRRKTYSRVSARGQTVIPAEIRKKAGVKAGTRLYWLYEDGFIKAVTLPDDPIRGIMGTFKGRGPMTAELLEERRRDTEADPTSEKQT